MNIEFKEKGEKNIVEIDKIENDKNRHVSNVLTRSIEWILSMQNEDFSKISNTFHIPTVARLRMPVNFQNRFSIESL